MTRLLVSGAASLVVALAACSPEPLSVKGAESRNFTVSRGQELEVILSTVGPGQYDSLPQVSSPALRYLDMSFVGPYTPAGPTQRFRFQAESAGLVTIVFGRSDARPAVVDTVEIQ